jgi:molybdopterin molybdotransferase
MLTVAEARARILAPLRPTATELVGLSHAWGRVLAAPVVARLTQPPADVSAMDGYALRTADGTPGARLRVVGEAPAGHPFAGAVGPGEAVRLFTGSVVPEGADTILLQEDATRDGAVVTVNEACVLRRHVREAGQDFRVGTVLLEAGRRLGARDIGLAAAGNHPWLTVHRRPSVAIMATGDEIAMPGEPIRPGGIVSSTAHAIAALVRAGGGEPVTLPVVPDDRDALVAAIDQVMGMSMLVTTGGASVGDHDLVQAALAERGFELDFWKIAMRPGKPLISGSVSGVPVLGLPGNPVSALICAALFLLPSLDVLSGQIASTPRTESATLDAVERAGWRIGRDAVRPAGFGAAQRSGAGGCVGVAGAPCAAGGHWFAGSDHPAGPFGPLVA